MESATTVDITKGNLISKLLRHGSLYFIGNAIMRSVSLLLIPLDTHLFTPDDYGTIITIISSTRVLIIFLGLYLDAAFSRFYHDYKQDSALLRRYVSTLYWFILGWGLFVDALSLTGVALFVHTSVPVWPVFVLAFTAPLFTQLSLVSQTYLQQNHRSGLQVSITLSNLVLNIAVMLIAVGVFKVGMVGKFIGIFCGTGLSLVLGTFIMVREGRLGFTFSYSMLAESLRFSIPLMPNIAAGWIAGFSDRILLSIHGPVAETGVYNVGYSLGMGLTLFSESVFMVYGPMMYAMMTQDVAKARVRIERFVPYYFMLMLWLCLALSLFAREIVTLLTPTEYSGAAVIVPVVLFAYFVGSQYKTAVVLLSFEKKTGVISIGAIIQAMINFGLNLMLIPAFGKMAAAWTTVLAIGFYTAWMVYWSQKHFRLRVNIHRIGLALLSAGLLVLVFLILQGLLTATWSVTVVLRLGILAGVLLMLWLFGGIETVDKARITGQARTMVTRYVGKAT